MRNWALLLVLGLAAAAACGKPVDRSVMFQCTPTTCTLECPAGATCEERDVVTCRRPPSPKSIQCYPTPEACEADHFTTGECHRYSTSDYLAR